MRDDFLGADWARQHGALTAAIHQGLANLGDGPAKLSAHQFDAPWRHDAKRGSGHAAS